MSVLEYDYLRRLPLAIHLPQLHTFVVHAGILPTDPRKPIHGKHQPLSHLPEGASRWLRKGDDELRNEQELSILYDIPQNELPWTLLNVRSITKKGKISRKGKIGTPWADMWNEVQDLCGGFKVARAESIETSAEEPEDLRKKRLPW